MSGRSRTEKLGLSEAERQLLPAHRQQWQRAIRSTAAADRATAERGIEFAYRVAGLRPPSEVVWCASPVEIERARRAAWRQDHSPLAKDAIVDHVITRTVAAAAALVAYDVRFVIERELADGHELTRSFTTLSDGLDLAANELRAGMIAAAILRLRGHASFRRSRWYPWDFSESLAFCSFLRNQCGLAVGGAIKGLEAIAMSAGCIVPYHKVCWASERPDTLSIDALGRLHAASGPAVRYRDGLALYAWKGLLVPSSVIEHAKSITARDIDNCRDPLLRRCMIDILTPGKYIAAGGARRVAADSVGVLWQRVWNGWDAWTAVEVVNGTPEPDGTFRHYFLQVPAQVRTPLEAVAWTYGMSPGRYAALARRT